MNKRIRELAEQALDYAEENQSKDIPQHWFRLHNEKFAELIVRECCQKLENDGMVEVAMELKEHFGVDT